MKIFVTGASGYIGFAVSSALAAAGHHVVGLVRSEEKAKLVQAAEIETVLGTMSDPSSYSKAAANCHVLVHCAAEYTAKFHELDLLTMKSLFKLAKESGAERKVVYTSGVWLYGNTGNTAVDETSRLNPLPYVTKRIKTEEFVLQCNGEKLKTVVIRPGCVYGGSGSLTALWFESAMKQGAAQIVGNGSFRWTMVHLQDLANLYLRAIESAYGGEIFNGTDRSRFTVLECAQAASRAVGKKGKVQTIPMAKARKMMGPLADCLVLDQHVDSSKAVRLLGWQPRHGGFVDGVNRYYTAWKATTAK
jgi:nucleoside-diphosphate-sugar epimerase